MSFKENISIFLKVKSDEIADDLIKGFSMPFNVSKQSVSFELTNLVDNKRYELNVSLKVIE